MSEQPTQEITELLRDANAGVVSARDKLVTRLYPRLRRLAARKLAANGTLTMLDTYGLLHEALEKLLRTDLQQIQNSQHLMAYAANVMRSVMVDHARRKHADKRDAGERVTLETGLDLGVVADRSIDLIALDEAMEHLNKVDPKLVTIVEMRCFAGLTMEEIAAETNLSLRTVNRQWEKARASLRMLLDPS